MQSITESQRARDEFALFSQRNLPMDTYIDKYRDFMLRIKDMGKVDRYDNFVHKLADKYHGDV
jgi:primosomal protein N''